jgi:hypothetical protein
VPRFTITITETPQPEQPEASCQPGNCNPPPQNCVPPQLCQGVCVTNTFSSGLGGQAELAASTNRPEELSPLSD